MVCYTLEDVSLAVSKLKGTVTLVETIQVPFSSSTRVGQLNWILSSA